MGNCHTETIAQYRINGRAYFVTLCWQGKEPEDDPDSFFDIFDEHGVCLNPGEPRHNNGQGVPTHDDVSALVKGGE